MLALPGHTSEQRTLRKTQNNHLTGKAPYKFESGLLQQGVTCEPNVNYRFRFVVARPHVVAMCAGVAWSRLYDGSEQVPDACGDPHGQRTPERDPYYAWHDTC